MNIVKGHSSCGYMKDVICNCGQSMQFLNYIIIAGQNGFVEYRGFYKCNMCKDIQFIDTDYNEIYEATYTKEYLNEIYNKRVKEDNRLQYVKYFTWVLVLILIFLLLFNI